MDTTNANLAQFFGVTSSDITDTIVEDPFLRDAIIKASVVMEKRLQEGQPLIGSSTVFTTEQGIEVEIQMERPKPDKPVIFKYIYRINRVVFKQWVDANSSLFGGPSVAFICKGMGFMIPGPGTGKYHKVMAEFVVKDSETDELRQCYRTNIMEQSLTVIAHREVVSNHDWIVKAVIP